MGRHAEVLVSWGDEGVRMRHERSVLRKRQLGQLLGARGCALGLVTDAAERFKRVVVGDIVVVVIHLSLCTTVELCLYEESLFSK